MGKIGPVPLLILWLLCYATAKMAPPANVTVHCHNLQNSVEWAYAQLTPGLRFKVVVQPLQRGSQQVVEVDAPTVRVDLPSLSDVTQAYLVTVTALFEQEQSDPAPRDGITFSYYNPMADKLCLLDFPPVNVTANEHGEVLFSFVHPGLVYHDRIPSKKSRRENNHEASVKLSEFEYDVEVQNQGQERRLICDLSRCDGSVVGKAGQEQHCLNLSGNMDKMTFKATQVYCATPPKPTPPNNHTYILVIAISLLLAGGFVMFMVFRKCTRPSSPIPSSMLFGKLRRGVNPKESPETFCVPQPEPSSPTPLLMTTEDNEGNDSTPGVTPTAEPDLRLPIGVSAADETACGVAEMQSDQEDGYLAKGQSLEDEDMDSSGAVSTGYEKRSCIVDLGPDEKAEGYRSCVDPR